ncbi:MAG: VTT domain-containing protein [Gammaproteobacteria bacterium]
MKLRTLLQIALLLVLSLLIIFVFVHKADYMALIQTYLQQLDRSTAALAYIGICILAALLMFPVSVLMLFSGAYFGLWLGFALNLLGFITGAVTAFLTARYLAKDQMMRILPASVLRVLDKLGDCGWKTVAVLRAIGIIPGVLVNYSLAITSLPLRTFIWASLVFTIPTDFILTYSGVAGAEFIHNGELTKLLVAASLVAAACIAGYWLRKRFLKV